MQTIEIEFTDETAVADWWTREIAPILCALCCRCPGWESEQRPLDCANGNPWCG